MEEALSHESKPLGVEIELREIGAVRGPPVTLSELLAMGPESRTSEQDQWLEPRTVRQEAKQADEGGPLKPRTSEQDHARGEASRWRPPGFRSHRGYRPKVLQALGELRSEAALAAQVGHEQFVVGR